jgi:hypothetical protein
MGIIINCITCKKSTEPILDKITNKVYCSVCDTEISVSHFVKVQLKDLKQYRNKKNRLPLNACTVIMKQHLYK